MFDVKTNDKLYCDAIFVLMETEAKLKELKELIRTFRDINEEVRINEM